MYLRRNGWTDADTFSIETAAGEIRPTITGETTCRVDMGRARLTSKDFPDGPSDGTGTVSSRGRAWAFQHVSIGNPQCAIRLDSRDELDSLDLAAIGPGIEHDPQFPNRTNTSFWCELEPGSIRARIFERGVGETLSSGTGASGAAVAHVLRGGDSPVTVQLDGGELEVDVDESLHVDLTGWAVPVYTRRAEPRAAGRARFRGMSSNQGAWGLGLATFAGDKLLDAWFPEPRLGLDDAPEEPGTHEVLGSEAGDFVGAARADKLRGVRTAPIVTVIADLGEPPADAADAYLRLHLLSHRLIRPRGANLDGIFGVLNNVAWTTAGPVDPAALDDVRLRFRTAGQPLGITGVDKFPRMVDYVRPVRRADRRRRPRPARRAPRRGHHGHARGVRQLQRRHARHLDGRGAHQRRRGGRRRLRRRRQRLDHGHAVGRRHRGHLRRRALPAGRQLRPRASRWATTARSRRGCT